MDITVLDIARKYQLEICGLYTKGEWAENEPIPSVILANNLSFRKRCRKEQL